MNDYKFDDLILAVRNVIKQGVKPMIKTGAVPLKYSNNPNVRPPYDYNMHYNYIKALAKALVVEFGINEVKPGRGG